MNEPFISINVWTDIFTILNLLILCLILKHFLYKPVKTMLDKRRQEVEETYQQADEEKAAAQQLKEEYEVHLKNARQEADQMVREASKKAQARGEEIVDEARKEAHRLVEKAEEEIQLERRRAEVGMKAEMTEIALLAAGKIVEKELSPQDHDQMLSQIIDRLGEETGKESIPG